MGMLSKGDPRPQNHSGDEESRTKQQFREECDINTILTRFRRTGFIEHVQKGQPRFLDVSDIGDYRTALDQAHKAEEYFMTLDPDVREAFDNDAGKYLDWITDPATDPEDLRKLGQKLLNEDPTDDRELEQAVDRVTERPEEPAPPVS